MQVIHTKPNFTDARGEIRDIVTHKMFDAITYITCETGAVRGNHFHKQTVQYTYILKGKLEAYTQSENDSANRTSEIVEAGDLVIHEPSESHAFKALVPSEILSLSYGPRKGEDYESDNYRLIEPMVV